MHVRSVDRMAPDVTAGMYLLASVLGPPQEAEQAVGVHALELLHLQSIPQGAHGDAAQAAGLPLPGQGRRMHRGWQGRWLHNIADLNAVRFVIRVYLR